MLNRDEVCIIKCTTYDMEVVGVDSRRIRREESDYMQHHHNPGEPSYLEKSSVVATRETHLAGTAIRIHRASRGGLLFVA